MTTLPIDRISPDPAQPRKRFGRVELDELTASIRSVGLLEPLIVRPAERAGYFRLVAGERRLRAAFEAGLVEVPVLVRDDLDERATFEIQMIENVIRADMDPMEEAHGYRRLLDSGLTVEAISERIGKSRSAIQSRLKLLDLHPLVADLVEKGHLDTWTAGHIARLQTESQFKVLRAMSEGRLPAGDKNAIDRLCSALQEQDQQASLMGDSLLAGGSFTELATVPTPDPERRASRELDDHIHSTLRAVERLAELLEAGVSPGGTAHELGDVASRLSKLSVRVTRTLHTQAAVKVAAAL